MQSPHPPIIIGGNGPNALKRVVAYADGWFPVSLSWPNEWLAERITELSRLSAAAGRPRPEVTLCGHPTDPQGTCHWISRVFVRWKRLLSTE